MRRGDLIQLTDSNDKFTVGQIGEAKIGFAGMLWVHFEGTEEFGHLPEALPAYRIIGRVVYTHASGTLSFGELRPDAKKYFPYASTMQRFARLLDCRMKQGTAKVYQRRHLYRCVFVNDDAH